MIAIHLNVIWPSWQKEQRVMYIIYSFIGSFLALVVYNLFGGKQFVEKKIKESKEQKEEN